MGTRLDSLRCSVGTVRKSLQQPIYDMLEELGEYENKFNFITGWPLYFLVTFYYVLACLQAPGSPVPHWVSAT